MGAKRRFFNFFTAKKRGVDALRKTSCHRGKPAEENLGSAGTMRHSSHPIDEEG